MHHHRGAATEGPAAEEIAVTIDGVDDGEGFPEEILPARRKRSRARRSGAWPDQAAKAVWSATAVSMKKAFT